MSLSAEELEQAFAEAGLEVDTRVTEALVRHYGAMVRWNRTHNLTRVVGREAAFRHYVDSVAGFRILEAEGLGRPGRAVDLGTGAGFPGLVGGLLWPETRWTWIDASAKRCSFLQYAAGLVGVSADIRHARGEDAADRWPLVVSRATFSEERRGLALGLVERPGAAGLWVGEGAEVPGATVRSRAGTRVAIWGFT